MDGTGAGAGAIRAAQRAVRVLSQPQFAKRHLERVEHKQAAGERRADADDRLDGLRRLQETDDPRQHAEDAGLLTRRRGIGRSELRKVVHHG